MKKLVAILIAVLVFNALVGQIRSQHVESKIKDLTVFYTSAEIEREAKVNLKKGMNKLVYSDITTKLEKESIYAVTGEGVSVVSINTHKKIVFPDQRKIKILTDSIPLLNDKINALQTELDILNKTVKVLDKNSSYTTGNTSDVNQIIALNNYYSKRIREVYRAINKNEKAIDKFEKLKTKISSDLNKIRALSTKKDEMVIELVLLSDKDRPAKNIKLKYMVGGAGWTPVYVINVDKLDDQLKMKFQAKVINQTGINWDNINMSFSTASLNKSQDAPALEPWNLNFNNRRVNEGRLDKYKVKDISKEKAARMNNGLSIIEGVKYVETTDTGIKNIYKTSNKYYIPSDSKTYFIEIKQYTLPVSYRYYSVPKVNANAYLMAQITDWEKYDLLEGQAKIWFNGNFVGESYLRPQLALDTLDLSLGSDDKIFVNKVKLKDKDSEVLIGLNKKQTFKYKITVKNTNATAVKFTLRDQLPVSQNDDIKVESIELSEAELVEDSGSLKWKFELQPGENREFLIAFSVKFPKNKRIKIRERKNTAGSYKSVRFL